MNFLKNKKFQYGSVAVIFTAVVIAVILVVNVVLSMLSSHFGWYADISASGLFRFSDEALTMLDRVDKENNKLTIYFCEDENTLSSTDYGKYVLALTTELENRYEKDGFVTVKFIDDINRDIFEIGNVFGSKYGDTFNRMYSENAFTVGTIVIRNDTYEVGENGEYITNLKGEKQADHRISVFSITDLYSEAATSFLGEYMLTARITGICHLTPTAYFLTGHSEMTTAEDNTYGKAEYLADIFESCGFEIKKLNLSESDFGDSVAEPSVAVIFCPTFDYTDAEINRLSAFVENGGHLMMFTDSVYRDIGKLNAFLTGYGVTVASSEFESGMDASVSVSNNSFAAEYVHDSNVIKSIVNTSDKAIVQDCRVLRYDTAKGAAPVLKAPASATLIGSDTEMKGNEAVAVYSVGADRGSVFVCGAASFAASTVYEPSYTNRDVILSVMNEMGAEDIPLNLTVETLATDGLDLTRSQAVLLTVLVSTVPALIFATAGIIVYVRRKRS